LRLLSLAPSPSSFSVPIFQQGVPLPATPRNFLPLAIPLYLPPMLIIGILLIPSPTSHHVRMAIQGLHHPTGQHFPPRMRLLEATTLWNRFQHQLVLMNNMLRAQQPYLRALFYHQPCRFTATNDLHILPNLHLIILKMYLLALYCTRMQKMKLLNFLLSIVNVLSLRAIKDCRYIHIPFFLY